MDGLTTLSEDSMHAFYGIGIKVGKLDTLYSDSQWIN